MALFAWLRARAGIALAVVLGLSLVATVSAEAALSRPAAQASLTFKSISNPADPTFDQLLGITKTGVIAGYDGSGADAKHPNKGFTIASPYGANKFVSENFPGSTQTQVIAITNQGDTAGFWVDAKGANHGFVDWNGIFTTVDDPLAGGKVKTTQLLGLNAAGVAVGFYNDAKGNSHAFKYNQETHKFTPLSPPGADSAIATGINAHDNITGFVTRGKTTAGFFVSFGKFSEFDLPGSTNTQPLGINDANEIVGSYVDSAGNTDGFTLTNPGSHAKFTTVNDPLGVKNTVINGINDKGQLVGFYQDSSGNTVGFLASP